MSSFTLTFDGGNVRLEAGKCYFHLSVDEALWVRKKLNQWNNYGLKDGTIPYDPDESILYDPDEPVADYDQ